MWYIYASLSALTAAFVAILGRLGLTNLDPTLAATIRAVFMALFLVTASVLLGKFTGFSPTALAQKDWLLILGAGVAGALSWLFYFVALKVGTADQVVSIDRLSIVMVVILAALFLGETLTWRVLLGAGLMVGGALLISLR